MIRRTPPPMNSVTNGTLSATNAVANETAIPFATAGKFRGKSPLRVAVANGTDNLFATAGKSRKVSRLRISVANGTANLFATVGQPALIKRNPNSTLSQKCTFLNFGPSTR